MKEPKFFVVIRRDRLRGMGLLRVARLSGVSVEVLEGGALPPHWGVEGTASRSDADRVVRLLAQEGVQAYVVHNRNGAVWGWLGLGLGAMFLGAGFVVFGFFLGLVGAGVGLLLAFFSLIFALKAAFPWAREHELADEARRGWAVRGRLQAMNPDQAGRLLAEERDGLLYGEGPTGAMLDRRRELRERLLE